jgi:hypothetical protein
MVAVTQDTQGGSAVNSTSHSVSVAVASNSDRLLLAWVMFDGDLADPPNPAQFNGVDMTLEALFNSADGVELALYSMVNPPTGTHTLSITGPSLADTTGIKYVVLYNVDQTDPLGTPAVNGLGGGAAAPVISVSCEGFTDGLSYASACAWQSLGGTPSTVGEVNGVPKYLSAGSVTTLSAGTSITASGQPAGRLVGDLEILVVMTESSATTSCSSTGWNKLVQNNSSTTLSQSIFWRIYDGTNVNPVVTWSGNADADAIRRAYRDAKTSGTPVLVLGTSGNGTTTTHTSTGGTTTQALSLAAYFDSCNANTAIATPSGWTEDDDAGSSTGPYRAAAGHKELVSAGASGNISVTGGGTRWIQTQVEILANDAGAQVAIGSRINRGGDTQVVSGETGEAYNAFVWTFSGSPVDGVGIAVGVKPVSAAPAPTFSGTLTETASITAGTHKKKGAKTGAVSETSAITAGTHKRAATRTTTLTETGALTLSKRRGALSTGSLTETAALTVDYTADRHPSLTLSGTGTLAPDYTGVHNKTGALTETAAPSMTYTHGGLLDGSLTEMGALSGGTAKGDARTLSITETGAISGTWAVGSGGFAGAITETAALSMTFKSGRALLGSIAETLDLTFTWTPQEFTTGTLDETASLTPVVSKQFAFDGALTATAAPTLSEHTSRSFTGSLSATGTLHASFGNDVSFGGSITETAALTLARTTNRHPVLSITQTSTLTPDTLANRQLTGVEVATETLTPAAHATTREATLSLSPTITATFTSLRAVGRALTLTETLTTLVQRTKALFYAGSLTDTAHFLASLSAARELDGDLQAAASLVAAWTGDHTHTPTLSEAGDFTVLERKAVGVLLTLAETAAINGMVDTTLDLLYAVRQTIIGAPAMVDLVGAPAQVDVTGRPYLYRIKGHPE